MTEPHRNRIDLIRPDAPELAAPGPHAVGVRTLEMVNPGQPDVLAGGVLVDRRLVVEMWYPAVAGTGAVVPYRTLLRDGRTEVALHGRALRGAEAVAGEFPLVILSHGFPGNRMLMSHLGENLASKGYQVASIDHPESTYGDPVYQGGAAFGSTLVNRPLDTSFVIGALGAGRAAIVGYSMGGYGALISAGASGGGGGAVAGAALRCGGRPAAEGDLADRGLGAAAWNVGRGWHGGGVGADAGDRGRCG